MVEFKCWYYETALADGNEDRLSTMIPDGLPPEVRVLTTRLTRGTIRPSARAADARVGGCAPLRRGVAGGAEARSARP